MTGIQGPRGGGGPSGPAGPTGPEGPDGPEGVGDIQRAGAPLAAEVERLRAADAPPPTDLAKLAADLDAGRVTGDEAIARLASGFGLDLGDLEGAEVRALIADLVATDPYLAELAARLGGGTS